MALYTQIFSTLQAEIEQGRYQRSFPSESQLVRRFAASRQTVIRAMAELVSAGLIERRRGSGTVVSRKVRQTLGCIGLVIPWFSTPPFANTISRVCREEGYTLLYRDISHTAASPEERAQIVRQMTREFADAKVSGVLMQPLQFVEDAEYANSEMIEAFRANRIPVVLVDHNVSERPSVNPCDVVGIDNFRAGYEIGRHLIERGAKRIAFLMREHWAPTVVERLHGVSAAAVEAGLPWEVGRNVLYCEPQDTRALSRCLRQNRPDAIACGNDNQAGLLIKSLRALKVRVPERVMVTGFDDLPHAALLTPSLTTVHQNFTRLAEVAALRLFHRIRNLDENPVTILIPTELIPRESTARL